MNWTATFESSWFVRMYLKVTQESWPARVHGRMAAAVPWLFRDLQCKDAPVNDDPVIRVFESSVAARAVSSGLDLASRAARESAAARTVATIERTMLGSSRPRQIRMAALAAFSAIVTHLLLTKFDAPEPTAAARLVWCGLLAFAAIVMAGASFLAAASSDSARQDRNGDNRE